MMSLTTVFIAKLKISIDDLIWLPPFLTKDKYGSSFFYLLAITIVTVLSWCTINLSTHIIEKEQYVSVISSFFLMLFSITYLRKKENIELEKNYQNVFLISLIGSIDEYFFFNVLFSTDLFDIYPVILGTLIAGCLVILVSFSLNKFQLFVKLLNSIKTWIFIFLIGFVSFIYSLSELCF